MTFFYPKRGGLVAVFFIATRMASWAQCPVPACVPGPASSPQAALAGMGIFNVTLGSLNNTTPGTADGYRDYSCTLGTALSPGLAYPVSIRTNANTNENVRAWIDYNNDGVFDPVTELFFSSNGARLHNGASMPVPLSATVGVPLRLRVAADGATAPLPAPCTTPLYSQTEDYRVTLAPNTQPPLAAFAVSAAAACAGTFAFADQSLRGPATWRWRFGDGSTSPLPNPTHTYAAPGTYPVTLRVCNANGCDSLTLPTAVTFYATNPVVPLCRPATQNYCCGYGIGQVQLGAVAYASTDGSAGYEDFSCTRRFAVAEAEVVPFRVGTGPNFGNVAIYADLNNNGDLGEPGELVWEGTNVRDPEGFLAIPAGARLNQPLRLRVVADAAPGPATPCAAVVRGQVEDYSLVVTPAPCVPAAAAVPTVLGALQSTTVDRFATLNVFFAPAEGQNQRVQWQLAPSNPLVGYADVPGGVAPFVASEYSYTNGVTNFYRARVGCGATAAYSPWLMTSGVTRFPAFQAPCASGRPFIQRVQVLGTTLDNASTCADVHGPGYTAYAPDLPRRTALVQSGGAYQVAVTTSQPARVSVFATESNTPGNTTLTRLLAQGRSAGAGAPLLLPVVFDSTSYVRRTGTQPVAYVVLRVRCDALTSTVPDPQVQTDTDLGNGETEDYYLGKTPRRCPATAAAGPLGGWQAPYCPADTVRLRALAPTPGSALQWQTSPDSLAWTDVPGATGLRWQTSTPASFYVRLRARGCAAPAYSAARRVVVLPYAQCYCAAAATAPAATWPLLTRVRVPGTPLDNASPAVPGGPALATYLPTAPAPAAALVRGATYALDLDLLPGPAPATTVVTAWLDTNANGAYDSLEWQPLLRLPPGTAPGTFRATLRVPLAARTDAAGPVGLRLRVGTATARPGQACAFRAGAGGEAEDYRVALLDAPCGPGPFTAGTLDTLARAPRCFAQPVLRVRGYSPGARLQWQQRQGAGAAPWRDLPGATNDVYAPPLTAFGTPSVSTYRVRASCGAAADTTAALADTRCLSGCSLIGGFGRDCYSSYLTDVALLGTPLANYGTACSLNRYPGTTGTFPFTWYPPTVPAHTATLVRGQTYTLWLRAVSSISQTYVNSAAWFDWNADGAYSAAEFYSAGTITQGSQLGQVAVTVPLTAPLGQVLLRAVGGSDSYQWYNACSGYSNTETEFYVVEVVDQPGPGVPVLTAAPQPLCAGGPLQLQVTGAGAGAAARWLGPAGFAATGLAPQLPAVTAANGGTYVAATTRNGQRVVSSVFAPVTTCLATRATVAAGPLRVFPNPTTGRCTLRLPAGLPPGTLAVVLHTPTGQTVARPAVPARPSTGPPAELTLDLGQLPPGLYFVELQVAGQGRYFGKVVRE